jgi:hypothetical protein
VSLRYTDGMDEKPGFRFSLRSLIGFVAAIAAGCGALVYASPWVAMAASLLTILLLLLSILGAIEGKLFGRVFWRGFAICGWAYFLLTVLPTREEWTLPTTPALFDLAEECPAQSRWPISNPCNGMNSRSRPA